MTQEEKAKAYDEALKRAKEMYDAYRFSVDLSNFKPTDFEYIFPQLAESEDERIRKIITDSVFYLYGAGAEYKDVLDYLDELEKQKEQKPNYSAYLDLSMDAFEACMLRYLQSAANRKNDNEIMEDTREYKKQLLDIIKQEQKPVEWSEDEMLESLEEEQRVAYEQKTPQSLRYLCYEENEK